MGPSNSWILARAFAAAPPTPALRVQKVLRITQAHWKLPPGRHGRQTGDGKSTL